MTAATAPEPRNAVGLPTYFTRFIGRDRELSALLIIVERGAVLDLQVQVQV